MQRHDLHSAADPQIGRASLVLLAPPVGVRPPSGKITSDQPSASSRAALSAEWRLTLRRSIGTAPYAQAASVARGHESKK